MTVLREWRVDWIGYGGETPCSLTFTREDKAREWFAYVRTNPTARLFQREITPWEEVGKVGPEEKPRQTQTTTVASNPQGLMGT